MTTVTKHSTLTLHDSIKTLNLALVQQAFQRDSSTLNELDSTVNYSRKSLIDNDLDWLVSPIQSSSI